MSLREEMTALRNEILTSRRHQTGLTTAHGEDVQDILGETAEARIPAFAALSEQAQDLLLEEVCPAAAVLQCSAVMEVT